MKCLLLLIVVSLLFVVTDAKFVKGKLKNAKDFKFLSKFCFTTVPKEPSSAAGLIEWKITNSPSDNVKLAFYDDDKNRWPSIYDTESCADKFAASNWNVSANTPDKAIAPRNHYSPHFWYVVAVQCGATFDLDYEVTFTNPYGNDKWIKQFSCDEVGLEGLYIFYFIFYIIAGLAHAYAVYSLIRASAYHSVVKLLSIAFVLEGLSVFSLFIHYAVYQSDGVGAPGLKGIGDFLDLGAQLVFILLLILVAKGWTITKSRIEDRTIVLIGLGSLSAAYLALFIWENVGADPASTKYVYNSAPGIIVIVLRAVAMLWFVWCLRGTYIEENHPSKRQFYIWFGAAFIAWFAALPFIALVASGMHEKHPWSELRVVTVLYVTANALALSGMQFLLWPSRANEYFQISSRLDLAGTIPYDAI